MGEREKERGMVEERERLGNGRWANGRETVVEKERMRG